MASGYILQKLDHAELHIGTWIQKEKQKNIQELPTTDMHPIILKPHPQKIDPLSNP